MYLKRSIKKKPGSRNSVDPDLGLVFSIELLLNILSILHCCTCLVAKL